MGTRTWFKLAVGLCIVGAVSAQYPYNSLYKGEEKDGPFRPSYFPSGHPQQQQYRQQQPTTTPAPDDKAKFAKIMKQINKVNDDGSYTFGFENDDGSFRVETRTKDGLVKGKYGFIDANGQLKVTEYTAGEKSDEPENDGEAADSDEENGDEYRQRRPVGPASRSQPLSARPQSSAQPRPYYPQPQSLASRPVPYAAPSPSPYRVGARAGTFDQAPAAQTTSNNVARAPPTTEEDFNESIEQDDPNANAFANRQSGGSGQEDPLNNQYFRQSVTPSGGSAAGQRGRFPGAGGPSGAGISAAGRPLPTQYGGGAPGQYGQQYPQGLNQGVQYGGFGGPGPQGFQGAGAPPQFGGPAGPFVGSPQDYNGFQQGAPQGFRRQAQQDFSSIGGPQGVAAPQGQGPVQSIQNFGGFGGFNTRQGANSGKGQEGNTQPSPDEQYVPSVELDGYSEDLDEDGYPDEPPKDGKTPTRSNSGASGAGFRPSQIGSQGIVQGGVQAGNTPSRGAGSPQLILQIGNQGGSPGAVGRFPGGQQGPVGFQGGAPNYAPQQAFVGFPQGAAQGFPQGFPQGFQGQGGFQGVPQQYQSIPQSAAGPGAQFQGVPNGGQIQNDGFPFEFGPFGGPEGFPQSGPQGFSQGPVQGFPQGNAQGFPASGTGQGFPQGNYPGEGSVQNFGGFPGNGAGGQQGFPVTGGRFAGVPSNAQGGSGGAQSFISGGAYPTGGLGNQASPTPSSSNEQKKA